MITECPSCKKVISTANYGRQVCPKCSSLIHIGNPVKDEESRVLKTAVQMKKDLQKDAEKLHKVIDKKIKTGAGFFKGTPWDNWKKIGMADAFIKTTVEIAKRPSKFFHNMKYAARPGMIPIYGLIAAFLAVLFQTFWMIKFFRSLFPDFVTFKEAVVKLEGLGAAMLSDEAKLRMIFDSMNPETSVLATQLLISPLMSIVITAFILHLGSVILGSKTRLQQYYRMSGFIMVTGLLSIVPIIGNIAGLIWRTVLVYKGGRVLNKFDNRKSLLFTSFYVLLQVLFSSVGII